MLLLHILPVQSDGTATSKLTFVEVSGLCKGCCESTVLWG